MNRKEKNLKKEFIFKLIITVVVIIGIIGIINLKDKKETLAENLNNPEVINLNPIENGTAAANLKLAFDWEKTYTKELTLEEAFDYLGKDVRPKYYPEDLMDHDGELGERIVYNNDDDKILLDTMYFTYNSDPSNTIMPMRFFNIEVSKLGYQPDCIIYVAEDEMKMSVINGVEMKLGYGEGTYLDESNKEVDYTYYYSEFYNEGVYYKVNSESLNQEEFIEVLKSLV